MYTFESFFYDGAVASANQTLSSDIHACFLNISNSEISIDYYKDAKKKKFLGNCTLKLDGIQTEKKTDTIMLMSVDMLYVRSPERTITLLNLKVKPTADINAIERAIYAAKGLASPVPTYQQYPAQGYPQNSQMYASNPVPTYQQYPVQGYYPPTHVPVYPQATTHPIPQRVPTPAAPKPASSPTEEIKKYKELLDMGAITQEDYNRKKNELLGF